MHIVKRDFGTVVRMWAIQAGSILLGVFLLLPSASETLPSWVMPLASAFTALFYLTLLFFTACELGLKDSVVIDGGRMKRLWYTGTLLSLVANAPAVLACVGACIAKTLIPGQAFFEAVVDRSGAAANVFAVCNFIGEILHLMYKGLFLALDLGRIPPIYLLPVLLSIIVCTFGYLAGTRGMLAKLLSRKEEK